MGYLLPADYAAFGLTADTDDAWVTAASAMIDAHCKRPSLAAQSYTERLRVGRRSHAVRVSYTPLIAVTAASARFSNGDLFLGAAREFGDPMAAIAFCGAGVPVPLDVASLDIDSTIGEVRPPLNLLGAAYRDVELTYTAGVAEIPDAVKVACAQIVRNAQATPGLNVKSSRLDTMQMEYFSSSLIDEQVRSLLQPYVAERRS